MDAERRARKRRYNPYIVGAPVFDRQLFFGREAAIRLTLERLASTSVQLSGERRIGKTSFLHHLELGLREPSSDDCAASPSSWWPGPRAGGDLERIELQPLAPEDAEALVTQPVVGIYSYEASAVERILEQSGLRPFEIQRCCLYAIHRMLDADRTTVRLADVEATP